jgi:acetyltransferase-like isoleucine patch superfamily enzyme
MAREIGNVIYSVWDVALIRSSFLASTVLSNLSLRLQGCKPGKNLRTCGPCHFKARRAASIRIGNSAVFLAYWRSNRVGLSGSVLLTTMGDGIIEIGDFFGASAAVISSRSKVTIGNHVMLGGNVRIYDHDFHAMDAEIRRTSDDCERCVTKPVTLGNDVFIGADAVILKGVTLGDRVVVGAGSVVTKSFPSDVVVAGNPARIINNKNSELIL